MRGDQGRLRQILMNLVGNAAKFTEKGGIRILCAVESDFDRECLLKFSVVDTGIGICAGQRMRLFQRFSQADSGISRRFGGTGLGLAISRGLVHLLGGEIGFESEPGFGSTFWFTARFQKLSSIECAGLGERDGRPPRGARVRNDARILLVEDFAINQIVARGILGKLGFDNVRICANGLDAIATLEQERFDLVLMDMQMPEMDGLEATAMIRNPGSAVLWHAVPIVAMTASASAADRDRCLAAGMDAHIPKPIRHEQLTEVLQRWLPSGDGS